jgi:DNA-binding LytR/AlgR family response regulator
MQLNYLIIDDEPIVHSLIKKFADDLGGLNFVDSIFNATQASAILERQKIDLLFLDIQMPALSGFEFLQTLSHSPYVIIISAHKDYALESYDYAITDYLLKPFNYARFAIAVEKVCQDINRIKALEQLPTTSHLHSQSIFIRDDKRQHKIALDDLIYIKANGNFTSVYHKAGHILSQMKISDFEKILPKERFSRIHRSYIVAHRAVSMVKANEIQLGHTIIPIGRVYKEFVAKILEM